MTRSRVLPLSVVALALLAAAPTVGDVGGCGRTATDLDREAYANARKREDCMRCQECGLRAPRCERACDPSKPPEIELPTSCRPLLHDGEVCLRALRAASCETYASYVDDVAPASPTECEFCRVAPEPAGSLSAAGAEAGAR